MLPEIHLPECTYIAAFLTLRCNYKCSYCINRHGNFKPRHEMAAKDWVRGLNRLIIERESMVPITLQGGEPTVHKEWDRIISGLRSDLYLDILTNFTFDLERFARAAPPERWKRDVPYAPIRVSFHPEQADFGEVLVKARELTARGYDVGIFAVDHPSVDIPALRRRAEEAGLDFRTKEFLGWSGGTLYGQYRYPEAVLGKRLDRKVRCRSTELLIAPDGFIHKCHRDLYAGQHPLGHICEKFPDIAFEFRECRNYGTCNECDIKVKNNRFQEFGACSVEIQNGLLDHGTEE